jgi:alpha-beta hydrolase superfamily lysophospholipase
VPEQRRRRSRWLRLIIGVLAVMLAAYVGLSAAIWYEQARIIFQPSRTVDATPADFGAPFEPVDLPLGGDRLAGWWLPAEAPRARTLLYLHGNAGNIGVNASHAVRLRNAGLNVFIFDYRGYGDSTGGPPRERLACEDAERAWTYLVQERQLAASEIVIYGRSLGGAIAIDLASKHPDAGALIAESAFPSIIDATDGRLVAYLPLGLIVTERFDSVSKARTIRVPKLILNGAADTTLTPPMAQRLYATAAEPKRLALIPGGHHDDLASVNPVAYFHALNDFLGSLDLKPRVTPSPRPQS